MPKQNTYEVGQRWEITANLPEWEQSLVIASVSEAHPEWHQPEPECSVYVQYSELGRQALPEGTDGVVLSLTHKHLDRNVVRLLESGVKLKWWWPYGRRFKKKSEAPNSTSTLKTDDIPWTLARLFTEARERAEDDLRRAAAIQEHFKKFPAGQVTPARSQSVAESWKRIIAWCQTHAGGTPKLNPGADTRTIKEAEQRLGVKFPEDFRESLTLHDGGDWWVLPNHGEFHSLEQIVKQWEMYRDWQQTGDYANPDSEDWQPDSITGPIKPIFWNTRRIHLTDNSGDHLTLDLDPPADGHYGQILDHSHEVGPERVLAPSWSEFLADLVHDLETGKYFYFEGDTRDINDLDDDWP